MKTVTDLFEPYIGTREYNGIVAEIQTWFYGYVYKASWCCTSMSFFLNRIGLLSKIGKKQENVYEMMEMCRKSGFGKFYYRKDIPSNYTIKRGTIVFMLNSGTVMTSTSSKHITSAYEDFVWKGSGNWKALGGNQSDQIKVSQYTQSKIYAIYWPYEDENVHETLRRGDKGVEVKELQIKLNALGYTDDDGNRLELDSSFGRRTEEAVKSFQSANKLVVDGVVGPITWAAIDNATPAVSHKIRVKTALYCRKGPGTKYKIIKTLPEGYTDVYTKEDGKWIYLKNANGWVSRNYVDIL